MYIFDDLRAILSEFWHSDPESAQVVISLLFIIGAASVLAYYLTKGILTAVEFLVSRTRTTWDDDLLTPRLLQAVSQLTPAILIHYLLPRAFDLGGGLGWIATATDIYILGTVIAILCILLSNFHNALLVRPALKSFAIKGIFQMVQLILIIIGVICSVALFAGKSPWTIVGALGASAAILMLVFKDTILGLVASVQLSANKMLQSGDWIVADKHNANGVVEDVSLTTVKIRNWDNSITTIPPYALISESFRNYQPMQARKARNIERSIIIDANSVRFCSPDELKELGEGGWLEGCESEASRLINLGLLRRHLEYWLEHHPAVRHDMITMVRQMPPTNSGLPLQLYFYTDVTDWKEFEHLQSDVFDYVYATIGRFGLRVFQTPAGKDFSA